MTTLDTSSERRFLFRPPGQRPAPITLICFPHSGGSAGSFRPWRPLLSTEIDLVVVELPGRGSRRGEPLRSDLLPLADEVASEIAATIDGPYALFGHSLGSLVAFEVLRCLEVKASVNLPTRIILSGFRDPRTLEGTTSYGCISDEELQELAHSFGGVPKELQHEPEMLQRGLAALRADLKMLDSYRFQEDPLCETLAVLFGAAHDPVVPAAAMDGWSDHFAEGPASEVFAGDHFYLYKDSLHETMQALRRHLDVSTHPTTRSEPQ